jgi:XTP/dITP diphosphohydrolase
VIPLLLATRNAHKTAEFSEILGADFAVSDLSALGDITPVEETGTTFEENATIKAIAASTLTTQLVVADDSGLEVDALGGAPGVYSARYAGDHATDQQNVAKLLTVMGDVPAEKRGARFRCVLIVAQGGTPIATFAGTAEGTIINSPSGGNGFGYDPVFVPEGFAQTFAELGGEKNRISHRAQATEGLRSWLLQARSL